MKQITCLLLTLCIIFAMSACQKEELTSIPSQEPPQTSADEPPSDDEPQEPMDTEPVEEIPFPGLPVYVKSEAVKAASQEALDNPDGEPQAASPDLPVVFDHFEDPPQNGEIRLVHVYNYGDTETFMVKDNTEINAILDIVDAFIPSDYDSGMLMGGYMVQIQVVRDGIHQCYSILSGEYDGGYIATNNREAENWYVTSAANFNLLMDYFD